VSQTALIAIGGNSLIRAGERGTIDEQLANAHATAKSIAGMIQRGWTVVITHGNGPQVGAALLRSERASGEVYDHPLDVCVATTQSEIGYLLQRAMESELKALNIDTPVATILTKVLVDQKDPAYTNPTKPIGPFYSKKVAEQKQKALGWDIVEDASRGYRRVVPSPEPKHIYEVDILKTLIGAGVIVIAGGGGGIPVIDKGDGEIVGSEAVIDKDRASSLLARELNVDLFIISTDADQVYVDFKKKSQRGIPKISIDELQKHYDDGQFPAGSMGPKVESAMRFIRNGGKEVIITSYEYLTEALEGSAGTHIVP
jgi:carbamate kinase